MVKNYIKITTFPTAIFLNKPASGFWQGSKIYSQLMTVMLSGIFYLDGVLSPVHKEKTLACVHDAGKPVGKEGRICYFCTDGIRLSNSNCFISD